MTTKCYFLDNTWAAAHAIDYATRYVPYCSVKISISNDTITATFEVPSYHVAMLERILAPYV